MYKFISNIFLLWVWGVFSSCSTSIEPKTNKDYLLGGWRIDEVSTVKKGTSTILKTWFKQGVTKQSNWLLGDATLSEEYKQFYLDLQDYEAYYRKDGKCSFMNTPFSIIAVPYSWLNDTTLKTNQLGVFGNTELEIENVKVDTKNLVFRMTGENVDNVSIIYVFDKVANEYSDPAKVDIIFTFKRIL